MGKLFAWISQLVIGTILLIPSVAMFSALALLTLVILVIMTYAIGIVGAVVLSLVLIYLILRGAFSHVLRKKK